MISKDVSAHHRWLFSAAWWWWFIVPLSHSKWVLCFAGTGTRNLTTTCSRYHFHHSNYATTNRLTSILKHETSTHPPLFLTVVTFLLAHLFITIQPHKNTHTNNRTNLHLKWCSGTCFHVQFNQVFTSSDALERVSAIWNLLLNLYDATERVSTFIFRLVVTSCDANARIFTLRYYSWWWWRTVYTFYLNILDDCPALRMFPCLPIGYL